MKKIILNSTAEVPNDLVYLINKDKIDEVVTKKLSEGIGEEVFEVLTFEKKEGKGIIEKTITSTTKGFNVHKVKLAVVNEEELDKLEEEKERLEKENERLKEKLNEFKAVGFEDVIEGMKKAKIIEGFIKELQELSDKYAERING